MCEVPFTVDVSTWPPLGRIVGHQRELRQLRRGELAEQVGVAASTIAAWELGSRVPAADHLRCLADALDLEVAVLAASVSAARRSHAARRADRVAATRTRHPVFRRRATSRHERDRDQPVGQRHHRPAAASLRRLAGALDLPFATVAAAAKGAM